MSPNTERAYRKALMAAELLVGPVEELPELAVLREAVQIHLPPKAKPQHESSLTRWAETIEKKLEGGVAQEIPFGKPQIEYSSLCGQWVPRGDVLRCVVTCDAERRAVVDIDGRELSMEEFGEMLLTREGWGMRISFVPEDDVDEEPTIQVSEPE